MKAIIPHKLVFALYKKGIPSQKVKEIASKLLNIAIDKIVIDNKNVFGQIFLDKS